jgi:hypothetical protein
LRQLGIYLNIWHIYGGPHLSLSLHIYKREERYQRIGSDPEVGDTGQHVAQGGGTPDRGVRGREREWKWQQRGEDAPIERGRERISSSRQREGGLQNNQEDHRS